MVKPERPAPHLLKRCHRGQISSRDTIGAYLDKGDRAAVAMVELRAWPESRPSEGHRGVQAV